MFSGMIKGTGPRYCPSIEDKVTRFNDKPRHQIFLEPEGRETQEVYVQGFSTSLPEHIQRKMVASIPGLENAEIMRAGYAIEYDAVVPTQLWPTLETKKIIPGDKNKPLPNIVDDIKKQCTPENTFIFC